jgi:hypothetical protein
MAMFDRSQFTTPRALIELMLADKFDKLPSTTTGEIRQFTAVALTDAVPLSRDQMLRYAKDPAGAATGEVISRFILKAMIIGDADGAEIPPEQNPHRYLLNPCNMSTSVDPNLVLRITKLYTTYVSSKDFNVSDGDAITIKRNDRILVTMTVDSRGNIVLDRGELTALLERAQDNKSLLNNCDALTGLFNTTTVTTLFGTNGAFYRCQGSDAECGPKDDPTFAKCAAPTYDSLPTQATNFQSYPKEDVIAAIRASGQPEDVQKIMYAFISKEQPSYRFPNNNVAGIQLDMSSGFAGTTQSDFDYQTCFRDNGGDQRIFAGFSSLQGGMVVFGKIIAAKMTVYRTLSGASISADADNLTWNYYRSWNTAFSPEELEQLKTTGQVVRSSETHERDWSATMSGFSKSLDEWNSI